METTELEISHIRIVIETLRERLVRIGGRIDREQRDVRIWSTPGNWAEKSYGKAACSKGAAKSQKTVDEMLWRQKLLNESIAIFEAML